VLLVFGHCQISNNKEILITGPARR
jgi:hypothetical protein